MIGRGFIGLLDREEFEADAFLPPPSKSAQKPKLQTAVHDEKRLYDVKYFVRDDEGRFHPKHDILWACDEFDAWLEVVMCEADRQVRAWWCLSVKLVPETETSNYTPENDD